MKTSVAIHQPNFLPWLGFFHKIQVADRFIFLDDVQFSKQSWTSRVKLLISGNEKWITAPVIRKKGEFQNIMDVELMTDNWRQKLEKTIVQNYGKTSYFGDLYETLGPLILSQENNLASYNINLIKGILSIMNFDSTKIYRSSELQHHGVSNELLISLVKEVGGDTYIAGGGASGYQEDGLFKRHGVELVYQNFQHPRYDQSSTDEFVPGLSILDVLFKVGPKKTASFICKV